MIRSSPTAKSLELRRVDDDDIETIRALAQEAFRRPIRPETWRRDGRVLTIAGAIQAAACLLPFEQFYGGRTVPTIGVAGVIVAPEARGQGIGRLLGQALLAEIAGTGGVAATLYPSTVRFYRSLGFEVAGARVQYRAAMPTGSSRSGLTVEPWDGRNLDEIVQCYRRVAGAGSGLLDRSPERWTGVAFAARGDAAPVYRYAVRQGGDVTGYVIYRQEPVRGVTDMEYVVSCHDLVWTSAESANALLAFVKGQRVFGRGLEWFGPIDDPLLGQFDGHDVEPLAQHVWMARLVDVRAALGARGYNPAVETAVELGVRDELVPANECAFRLEVSGGRATLHELERARVSVDVGTLSSLYTGWLGARDGQRVGGIRDARDEDVDRLEAIFAGPKPWLLDAF